MYDLVVYIGRFQPFHNGHKAVIEQALELGSEVLVLVGSCNKPRSSKNPFSYTEREYMITSNLSSNRVFVEPLNDHDYDDELWIEEAMSHIEEYEEVAIIGYEKDESSYYLKAFPEWDVIQAEPYLDAEFNTIVSSTDIRDEMFGSVYPEFKGLVSPEVAYKLRDFRYISPKFAALRDEYQSIKDYKESWKSAPFPPVFVTVDALVVRADDTVLLIRRKNHPGKGLWALPGGFLASGDASIKDAMLRELKEETGITDVEIGATKVFDSPHRGERGRTITHAFLCKVPESTVAIASDDAEEIRWCPMCGAYGFPQDSMYADHLGIIREMLK